MAAWAAPAGKPAGAVLVIHENRGLTEHIRSVAGRFAANGYAALALDLLSEEGGTAAFPGEAEVAAALSAAPPERFDADMKAARRRAATARPARSARRNRVLLRGRHGLATAGLRRAAAGRCRAVLRAVPARAAACVARARRRARRLRRARRARQRDARSAHKALDAAGLEHGIGDLQRGRPRLLQRHRRALQRARRRAGLARRAGLVRQARRVAREAA